MRILLLLITILIFSCQPDCELEYFNRISGIELTSNVKIIQCEDNTAGVTIALIQLKQDEVTSFIDNNKFTKLDSLYDFRLIGLTYLTEENQLLPSPTQLLQSEGRTESNSWYYLVDTKTGKLWAQILYPDWGGTNP